VIATDGSPEASEAIDVGLTLAAGRGAHAVFVHVVPPPDFRATRLGPAQPDDGGPERPEDDPVLQAAAGRAREHGVPFESRLRAGEPAPEIAAVAADIAADLVVVGSRGRGTITGTLLGSVSRDLLGAATCAVVVVRGARPAQPSG
jgi:nucleotide-binding universal stress UspA family protein